MTRIDIVNKFICTRAYTSCLEITTRGCGIQAVHCARRVCVSPSQDGSVDVHSTSDLFFASNTARFDVILLDGAHSCSQTLKDIGGALRALNPGGVIIVHNCLPGTERMASPEAHGGEWCGDIYRAAAWYFAGSPYLCYAVDTDYGCGIIDTACPAGHNQGRTYSAPEALSYSDFDARRVELLNVVEERSLGDLVARGLAREDYGGRRPMYVVTPTGDRPEAFDMCVDYLNRQTLRPDMWIIVDDGRSDAVVSQLDRIKIPYMHMRLTPDDSRNTLLRNLSAAFGVIPSFACVCVMEDDDWYPANYVETVYSLLCRHDFVSVRRCRYYHARTRQWRVLSGTPTHGDGWSGAAFKAIKSWVDSGILPSFDNKFGRYWCGTSVRHDVIPGHIVGFGSGRAGSTPSHNIKQDASGWKQDPTGRQLYEWIGSDAARYLGAVVPTVDVAPAATGEARKRVYVISNVEYDSSHKLQVAEDDILVFLNKARSLDFYDGHKNRYVYRRKPAEEYGDERLGVYNRYVFDAGKLGIPSDFINKLKSAYDWDYPIEEGKVKSATTGYMVAKYMAHKYPEREVVLVNFGYSVSKSTYRCPWHNWRFEAHDLAEFRHVFTAKALEGGDGQAPYVPKSRTEDEKRIASIFTVSGSDRMTNHDYTGIFTEQVMRLSGKRAKVAEIGGLRGSGVRAFKRALPDAEVYGVGVKKDDDVGEATAVYGDGYSADTWKDLPYGFDLIVDDGTHRLEDMVRGIGAFVPHLAAGGVLIVEDISSEEDAAALVGLLPGSVLYHTPRISSHNDDRVVVYVRPAP